MCYSSAGISAEENQRCSQIAIAVSSGSRSTISQIDRADHAPGSSGAFMHCPASDAPTQGMKYEFINGFTLKPAGWREMMIASPTTSDGRQGKIIRPCGRSAFSHETGGATTPALT